MKNKIKYLFSCILVFNLYLLNAQETKTKESNRIIDSLFIVLKTSQDTSKVNVLNTLSIKYLNISIYEQALKYAKQAQLLAENIKYKKGIANSYYYIGFVYYNQFSYKTAHDFFLVALKNYEEIGDQQQVANLYNIIGTIYETQGDFSNAVKSYLRGLKTYEIIGDKLGIADSYNNIGVIYKNQGFKDMALENYLKSLKIYNEIGDKEKVASAYNNIGVVYYNQHNYNKSLESHKISLKISEEIGDKQGMGDNYSNIGNIYWNQEDYEQALDYHLKSLKIRTETEDKFGMAISWNNIGIVYVKQKKFEESYYYLNQALILAKEIGNKDLMKEFYSSLSELYEKKGDYKQAYNYHKLYADIKDTLLNEQSNKQIAEMNAKYESEKKEKDILLLTKDKDIQQAEIGKQKLIRNSSIGALVFALLLAFVLFNRFYITRKQKKIIESQNFQIVESINYSKKIQDALLPSIESMRKSIPDLFLFYEPKDIVSGDFYYLKEFEKYTLLACVDCTGHGVPGGFMSTLGSLLLDKIANDETLSPSEILNKLSDEIIRVLHQQDGGEIQDGMDLSICLIDRNNRKIEFSGARNGIIIVTNNQAKRYKADLLPVGGNYMKKGIPIERNFKTQSISINANDWIYMYTDGFMEQVGGTEGIPMNYMQFENRLINVSKQRNPLDKICILQTELDDWRGIHERDDDILIIGFQIV